MEQKQKSDLENLAIATPIFYAFIVFCGSLYQHIYYYYFGISIFKFLEITEILVSFLDILILILTLFGVFILLIMAIPFAEKICEFVDKKIAKIKIRLKWKGKEKKVETREQKSFDKKKWLIFVCFFSTIYIVSIILFDLSDPKYNDSVTVVYMIYIILIVLFLGFELAENKKEITNEEKRHIVLYIVMAFLVSTVWYSSVNITCTMEVIKKQIVTIVTNDTIIKTDTNYIYIGRTNNYVFLRNSSKKRTDILSEKEIKKISFE